MANAIRCVTKIKMLTGNLSRQLQLNPKRTLFTESSMAITEYKYSRDQVSVKYNSLVDGFKDKMRKNINDDQGLIFTEDLKTALHLAEKNSDDIELIKNLLIKFTSQNSEVRFGSFKFGPVVMRTFHYLNEPQMALELFMDPKFTTFFNQMTSFMILLDLLYENKMYKEVRDTYDHIKENMLVNSTHPKLVIPILAMACYQENTAASLEHGLRICEDLSNKGSIPLRRVIATLGALALKQNKPHIALELVALCKTLEYVSIRCVRIMALADLDRLDDIVLEFQSALKRGIPSKYSYFSDAITKVIESAKRLNTHEDAEIFELIKLLKARGYTIDTTLEEHLSLPIETVKKENTLYQSRNNKYEDQGWGESRRQKSFNNRENPRDTWRNEQYSSA